MTFYQLLEGQWLPFSFGVVAILAAIFILWRSYLKRNEPAKSWISNKGVVISVACFLILRGGSNLIKVFDRKANEPQMTELQYSLYGTRTESDLKDNSISISDFDTVDVTGYKVNFAKCDSVFMPPLFKDQKQRSKITETLSNSWDQAKAIEQYLQSRNKAHFRATNTTLTLFLEDGDKMILPKWDSVKETGNNFENFFEQENYYLIYNQWAEGNDWTLVNRKSGSFKRIIGEPYFSPNRKRILSVNADLFPEYSPNGIELLEISGDSLISNFIVEVKNWEPVGVKWINDSEAILEVRIVSSDPNPARMKKGFFRIGFVAQQATGKQEQMVSPFKQHHD